MNSLGPFGCILAFCASLMGGGPQSDQETPLVPVPESLEERYLGHWSQGEDSECSISLIIERNDAGELTFRLSGARTAVSGHANATEQWIYLDEVASANFDASAGVLVFRNQGGPDNEPAISECDEKVIVLVPGKR